MNVGYTCMVCGGFVTVGQPHVCLYPYAQKTGQVPPAMGCVCPPGANFLCQNPLCPRKAPEAQST